jgi:NAD(P)-dependent dehydrogenase (short-subunit alcohol dehydrogenase family)
MRFEGQVAIVTGAAKGIGLRVARAFGREGARVAALDVNADGVEGLAGELAAGGREALALKVDVTVAGEVRRAVDTVIGRWGRVDVLVNNAGGFSVIRRTEDIPDEEWDAIFRFNVTSAFLCTKAVLPHMRRQRSGSIVNLSSIAGHVGMPGASIYVASKHAIEGLTKAAALEGAAGGVRVNAVAPGPVETAMLERFVGGKEDVKAGFLSTLPAKRAATTEEIAQTIVFLGSDKAKYLTGQIVSVDGGYSAQ